MLKEIAFAILKAMTVALRKLDLKAKAAGGEEIDIAVPDEGSAP